MNIVLDYQKDQELFDKTARNIAEKEIGTEVKTTQIRKFYDKVLELYQEAEETCMDKEEEEAKAYFQSNIVPFIKMLNSKVAYASNRKTGSKPLINNGFKKMMETCIMQVNSMDKLKTFKLFFEAIIGFHSVLKGAK